ncbi:hypothetical protein Hanom_Chr07g00666501 [Helianthus anomalus]
MTKPRPLLELLLCTLYSLGSTMHVFVFIVSFLSRLLLLPSHLLFYVDIVKSRLLAFVELHVCHLHRRLWWQHRLQCLALLRRQ